MALPLLVALCVLGACSGGAVSSGVVSYEGAQLLRVATPTQKHKEDIWKLEDDGDLQTWGGLARNDSAVDVLVKLESEVKVKAFLQGHDLQFKVIIDNLQRAIEEENPTPVTSDAEELEGRKGHRLTWQSYHRLADIYGYLDYVAQTYPDLCQLTTIGNSVEGRPLKLLTIRSGKPGAPGVWIDGGVHAREWVSPASVTYIINELVENRGAQGPAMQAADFHILAVANPDGYEHSHTKDRLWRKNRGNKGSHCGGVDLNRNFGYKWGGPGASKQPCKETFAGAGQFSEPETKAMSTYVLQKAASLKASVSFHSYGQYILYPWGYDRVVPPDYRDLQRVGKAMGQAMQGVASTPYTVGSAASTLYPASGGSDDWAKGVAKIKYTYTVELRDKGQHGFVLPSYQIVPTAQEALAGIKALVQELA